MCFRAQGSFSSNQNLNLMQLWSMRIDFVQSITTKMIQQFPSDISNSRFLCYIFIIHKEKTNNLMLEVWPKLT